MMNRRDMMMALVEAASWFGAVYYTLYTIKHDVNLFASTLIILAFVYLAAISCPVMRRMQAWKDVWSGK